MNYERLLRRVRQIEEDSPKRERLIEKLKHKLGKDRPGHDLARA